MQIKKYISLMVMGFLILTGCNYRSGSGNVITETRSVGSFTAVKAYGGVDVELSEGPVRVVVEADDNLIDDVETDVIAGELHVGWKGVTFRNATVRVYITTPEIEKVSADAGAEVKAMDVLRNSRQLTIDAGSGAEMKAQVDAPEVRVKASSGSEVQLEGRTRNLEVNCTSAGEVDARNLKAETVDVRASSGASAEVFGSVEITASASSGGEIRYVGGGETRISTSSGGSVKRD